MDRLPFSVYDFFGYLSAGFLLLVGITTAFVGIEPLQSSPNLVVGILLVTISYVVGHVIANLSGFLLEGLLVGRVIGRPTPFLFAERDLKWRSWLFPGYIRPLPEATRERVLARATLHGVDTSASWALFIHCHAVVKKEPVPQERLNIFLNLYGFCRNCALASVLVGLALIAGSLLNTAETGLVSPGWWAAAALVCGLGLFYRYLKFFRHYAIEVFASYGEVA